MEASETAGQAPLGDIERALIDEFIRARGYDPRHLDTLPEDVRKALLTDASMHASARLTEIEARSRLTDEMRRLHESE